MTLLDETFIFNLVKLEFSRHMKRTDSFSFSSSFPYDTETVSVNIPLNKYHLQ